MSIRVARGSHGLIAGQRRRSPISSPAIAATDTGNSKLVIAVPSGSPNESAAMRAVGDMRAADQRLTASPKATSRCEPYNGGRDANAPIRLVLSALRGRGARVRALADQSGRRSAQPALSELRLRAAAQSRRPDRQSGRPARAAHDGRRPMPSAARSCSTSTSGQDDGAPTRAPTSACRSRPATNRGLT